MEVVEEKPDTTHIDSRRWLRKHRILPVSIVFFTLLLILLVIPMDAFNVHYTATFNKDLNNKSRIEFQFDPVPELSSAAVQTASVNGEEAHIRLDPLNLKSNHLSIKVTSEDKPIILKSFTSTIQVGNHKLWKVSSIDGHEIHHNIDNGINNFVLTPKQMNELLNRARHRSELKAFLLTIIVIVYLLLMVRYICFPHMKLIYFVCSSCAIIACLAFLVNLWIGRSDVKIWIVSYKALATFILIFFICLIGLNASHFSVSTDKRRRIICWANYTSILGYAICQFLFYVKYYAHSYDEMAHLSYVSYERVHTELVPHFENMQIYRGAVNPNGSLSISDGVQFNQLGHPPLYYLIMSHLPGISSYGEQVNFHLGLLRGESFLLGLAGIAVVFYIGFTRIRKVPLLHLLFALMIISPPNLIFVMSGLNNDTLAFLTSSIFILGCVRFVENRFNIWTYLLIAVGISATLLTKLTAGMVVCFIALIIVVYSMFGERDIRSIFCKNFFLTVPIYLIPGAYFINIYYRYHTIQPSFQSLQLKQYLQSSFYVPLAQRQELSVVQYFFHFWNDFINYWNVLPYLPDLQRSNPSPVSFESVALTATLLLPLLVLFLCKDRVGKYLECAILGTWIVIVYQFFSGMKNFYEYGYFGGTQSRYYLCVVTIFALSVIWIIERTEKDKSKCMTQVPQHSSYQLRDSTMLICSGFCIMLVMGGFILSVLYHVPELSSFAS